MNTLFNEFYAKAYKAEVEAEMAYDRALEAAYHHYIDREKLAREAHAARRRACQAFVEASEKVGK